MFHVPAHKQVDPSKLPAQRVNPIGGVTAREAHRAAHLEKLDAACARPLGRKYDPLAQDIRNLG